ncbi:MAG: PAS domain-containing protein [Firmicutes bacterium]|nr:PAS domain-containing protein [Bacillota bacterium]
MLTGIAEKDQVPFLMATLSCIGDGIIVTEPQGKVLYINASAEILTGWGVKEALGRPFGEVFPLINYYTGENQENPVFKALRQGESVGLKNHTALVTRTGRRFFVSANCSPIYNKDGGAEGVVVVFRDIDRIKSIEEEVRRSRDAAQRASRIKSEFIANMSHEIRTPLNGLLGMVGLLLRTEMTPEQRELIQMLEVSANNLLHVIGGILDYSQIEAGKIQVKNIPFDLQLLLDGLLALHRVMAEKKGLKLRCKMSPSVPRQVVGDPHRLGQILNNLLGNAIKFTAEGEVTVVVRQGAGDGPGIPLEFSVADTGCGIAPQEMDLLFQRFTQLNGSTTRRHGGTGLGLAIAKQLAGLMGGTISVQSQVGKGSTFTLRINLAPGQGPPAKENFPGLEEAAPVFFSAPGDGYFRRGELRVALAGSASHAEGRKAKTPSPIFSQDLGEVLTNRAKAHLDPVEAVGALGQLMEGLRGALGKKDTNQIEGTAKEIKRLATFLEAQEVVELAFRIQLASRKGQWDVASGYCGTLAAEIKRRRDEDADTNCRGRSGQ